MFVALSVELATSWDRVGFIVLSAAAMLAGIIGYSRWSGLRTFSKMSTFDFAVTVAIGSVMASVVLSGSSLIDGIVAVGALVACQALVAVGRLRFGLGRVVDNRPILLMRDGEMRTKNLAQVRVTEDDVRAKLREANVLDFGKVRAVVLETTGDVSVLHGEDPLAADLLSDVIDPSGPH